MSSAVNETTRNNTIEHGTTLNNIEQHVRGWCAVECSAVKWSAVLWAASTIRWVRRGREKEGGEGRGRGTEREGRWGGDRGRYAASCWTDSHYYYSSHILTRTALHCFPLRSLVASLYLLCTLCMSTVTLHQHQYLIQQIKMRKQIQIHKQARRMNQSRSK